MRIEKQPNLVVTTDKKDVIVCSNTTQLMNEATEIYGKHSQGAMKLWRWNRMTSLIEHNHLAAALKFHASFTYFTTSHMFHFTLADCYS